MLRANFSHLAAGWDFFTKKKKKNLDFCQAKWSERVSNLSQVERHTQKIPALLISGVFIFFSLNFDTMGVTFRLTMSCSCFLATSAKETGINYIPLQGLVVKLKGN